MMNTIIINQENQSHLLLTVSRALVTVGTRDDLFRVMDDALKPLVNYDDSGLFIYNNDCSALWPLMSVQPNLNHRLYDYLFRRASPIDDFFHQFCSNKAITLKVWQQADLLTLNQYPPIQYMLETGVQTFIAIKLIWAGRLLGHWGITYNLPLDPDPTQLLFLESITQQLALAVANVLANEAVAALEYEKALEVAVGQALLTYDDWPAMITALARELYERLSFQMMGILLNTATNKTEQSYEITLQADGSWLCQDGTKCLEQVVLTDNQHIDLFTSRQAAFREPAIQVGDGYDKHCQENRFSALLREGYGLRSGLYLPVPLKHWGVASLFLGSRAGYAFTETDLELLVRLRSQLALSLENYLAYTEIARLKETTKMNIATFQQALDQVKAVVSQSPTLLTFFQQLVPEVVSTSPESTSPATLRDVERNAIISALQKTGGRIRGPGGAAELLAIEPNTLDARMRKLGIVKGDFSKKST
jgi:GAF domain-containing protein